MKRDKTVQEVKVDITEVIETAPPSGGGEEEPDVGVPGSEIHIEVPVPEDKVVVDDLEPGTDEGDGGIGGDVDDWVSCQPGMTWMDNAQLTCVRLIHLQGNSCQRAKS